MKILLIDDHAAFCANAARLLEDGGHEVVGVAADGRSGLAEAQRLAPDVVLLDIGLPDVSGLEIARELSERSPDLPVVMISTHDEGDYGGLALTHGARGFLTKQELSGEAVTRVVTGGN